MIDKTKQYKTRSGLPVRIYATDSGGNYPVHGAILKNGRWVQHSWTSEGKRLTRGTCSSDLIEVKPRIQKTMWLNVYNYMCKGHVSREEADRIAAPNRRACIQIEIDCEEGEGL